MNSNRKGKVGEREWSKFLTARGFPARRGQQYEGGHDSADIICPLLDPLFHPEVKRTERLSLYDAIDQAARDAEPFQIPYVAHRRNHCDWLVILRGEDFVKIARELI